MEDNGQLSAVYRTMLILETLSNNKSINLENLAKDTQLPKATLKRFLNSLINLGYVYRDPNDLYSLTLKMFSIGSHSLKHMNLIDVALPLSQDLCDKFKETVHMGILEEDHAVYILKRESSFTLRMYSRVGKRIPLYCTAIGKNLLADMSKEELDTYFSNIDLKPFTINTLNKEKLVNQLSEIREKGWAEDNQEHEEGIICIGSSIKDYSKRTVAALSVSFPLFRFDESKKAEICQQIKETCENISSLLGYQKETPQNEELN